MKRLEGKSAVVTGAASGIGRATALLFAEHGAKVIAVDRAAEVEATAEAIRAAGGQALALMRDTSQEADVADYIEVAVRSHGGLDVVYANAGVSGGMRNFDDWSVDDWTHILSINLIGTFLAIKYAARVMVPAGRGSIICTASVAGLRSGAGGPPYSASKAGVVSLVQTSANQFGGTGIRINAICPGLIETGMTQPIFDRARERGTEQKIGQLNPLRRGGLPHEIAYAALFLASDEASYVNGQALPVDGGLTSSLPVVPPRL
ncbi:MAG: SDR family oxidoreductase [Rhizobacter sp.]|nr:SDR family oxidoreductase [Rhizobacter sp.]